MTCFDRLTGLSSLVHCKGEKDTTETEVTTVAVDWYNWDDVDLMKIDVEGFELQVIQGARETIGKCLPMIQAEIDHLEDVQELYDLILGIDPGYVPFTNTGAAEYDGTYRFVKGKIDRFFLHRSKFPKSGFLY
jgi:hypothetical protein